MRPGDAVLVRDAEGRMGFGAVVECDVSHPSGVKLTLIRWQNGNLVLVPTFALTPAEVMFEEVVGEHAEPAGCEGCGPPPRPDV